MALDIHAHRILILDFGSQYTQLIARRVREIGVYCELHPFDMDDEAIREFNPRGIILAGGPESVHEANSPRAPQAVFDLKVPVLGICYGMQTMAEQMGGKVEGSDLREFGYARVDVVGKSRLLDGIEDHVDDDGVLGLDVWMSHGDKVTQMPGNFSVLASTPSCPIAGMYDDALGYYGVQFHPEVTHTKQGGRILSRFVQDICGCEALWTASNIVEDAIAQVRAQVGSANVLLGLSGGVDSSVVAALLHRAIGDQLTCVFVDNGLLRLAGAKSGKAHVIKSHHNVGGLPEEMNLKLVEPLRELFKDEVRKIGLELGLPYDMVYRHPFPGPGLGVRILGEVKKEYADILRRADHIFIEELRKADWYHKTSQAFVVFQPVKSVGVVGDGRRYAWVVALRAVETVDFMTARWAHLPYELLETVSGRIINEIDGISRVTYDVSSKPPATIEWE
ncbi:glutamine-hydrolyzing GMP synthase [Pseudomonas soli]|uniref:glutamine-hydrolyzing GMP synthase n=1 Tax=Pseudomonas soli TaxID=1306993 RepID=UPI0028A6B05C|nr:glutamine-hydrolyzing GMP synthase [Pseudomonas soli]